MSFSVIDKFIFILFFCFVSCHDDYPFEKQSHVSYFDLEKGKVKDVQIFAERAKIIDNGYDILERTDIQQIESPLSIFYCKYCGNDFPFHKIENVNMYYMPLKYMRSAADKISDVLISFNDTATTEIYTIAYTLSLHDALPIWEGSLKMDNGITFLPNDRYLLENEKFRLYYTAAGDEAHNFIVVVEDNFSNSYELEFDFNNRNVKDDDLTIVPIGNFSPDRKSVV